MRSVKVVGIGSPYGNDRLGWHVVERLKSRYTEAQLEIVAADRPGILLLQIIQDTGLTILIDAVNAADRLDDIVCLSKLDLVSSHYPFSSHDIGIREALSLGQTLNILPNDIILFGLCVDPGSTQPISEIAFNRFLETIDHYIKDNIELPDSHFRSKCYP